MGADLYIQSQFLPQHDASEPRFTEAVKRRDSLPKSSAAQGAAQEQVDACYEQLYGRGYFRDSYNDGCLLWKFNLSWWEHVLPRLDKKNRLSVADARWLLSELRQRENIFAQRISVASVGNRAFFRRGYEELKEFLSAAMN
jgi:hypothetical protein